MAKSRKSHVKRLYKMITHPETNEKERSRSAFMDVLRIDNVTVRYQVEESKNAQTIQWVLLWNDDENNKKENVDDKNADKQYENANAKRKTTKREIRDPQVKKADDTEPLELWIVKNLKVTRQGFVSGAAGQTQEVVFANNPRDGSDGEPSKSRKTTVVKVPSNDLGGMKMRRDDGTAIMRDWAEYREALMRGKVQEDDTEIVTEFTDKFTVLFGASAAEKEAGAKDQNIVNVLQNAGIINLFELGDEDAKNVDNKTAVIRVDPFQYIVNIGTNVIAVEYMPEDE